MTHIQERAIQLIQRLPDAKVQAFITLVSDGFDLGASPLPEKTSDKKRALMALKGLKLDIPPDFDAEKELAAALEEKYGPID